MGKFLRELNPATSTTTSSLVVTSNNNTDETYKNTLNNLSMTIRNLADITCFNSLICEGELSSSTLTVIRQSPSPEVSFNVDNTGIITTPFQPYADIYRASWSSPIPYNTWTRLTFQAVITDRHNNMDPTWIFHAPVPGVYLVNAIIKLDPTPDQLEMRIANSNMTSIYGSVEHNNNTTVLVPINAVAYIPTALYTLCVWVAHWDYENEIKFMSGHCMFTKIG